MSAVARFAPDQPGEAAEAARRDGVVVMDGLWSANAIDSLRTAILRDHPEFADKAALTDYLDNGEGRFIAPVALTDSLADLLAHPALDALYTGLLGERWEYEAAGMLMVFPGAPAQKPHRDGGLLFPETGLDRVLPPAALTVVIPLVDVDAENAPTGFVPGTHRLGDAADGEIIAPTLARGSASLWDFRVLHGGQENNSNRERPALYLTVCRPFWHDKGNFKGTARRRLIALPDVLPRLGDRFRRAEAA